MNLALLFPIGLSVLALALFIILFNIISRRRVVVPTNMVHIVQSGSKTTSYGKGRDAGNVYYAWGSHLPFIGVTVTELKESVFTVELNNYEAYDAGRLPFKVDIRAFFRLADSDTAAHRVSSFEDLHNQLMAVLQGVVRRVLATNKLEEIMQDRAKLAAEFTAEVEPQLGQWGIQTVKSIEFMDIRDHDGSQVIANIMAKEQSRIQKESRIAVANNHQEAESREIEAQQAVDVRSAEAEQKVGERQAQSEQAIGIAAQRAKQAVAEEAKTTAEKEMATMRVKEVQGAEIARSVAEVAASQNRQVMITTAEGQAEKARIEAEGNLAASENSAKGITLKGEAEGAAAKALALAPIQAQIVLAKEIGENKGYQDYLIRNRQVEASQAVGVAQADALSKADVKIIANGGDITSGISSVSDMLGSKGGVALGAILEGLATSEVGAALISKVTGAAEAPAQKAAKFNGKSAN